MGVPNGSKEGFCHMNVVKMVVGGGYEGGEWKHQRMSILFYFGGGINVPHRIPCRCIKKKFIS